MKTLFLLTCLAGFLLFCAESAQFASNMKVAQITKIETALNQ